MYKVYNENSFWFVCMVTLGTGGLSVYEKNKTKPEPSNEMEQKKMKVRDVQ